MHICTDGFSRCYLTIFVNGKWQFAPCAVGILQLREIRPSSGGCDGMRSPLLAVVACVRACVCVVLNVATWGSVGLGQGQIYPYKATFDVQNMAVNNTGVCTM